MRNLGLFANTQSGQLTFTLSASPQTHQLTFTSLVRDERVIQAGEIVLSSDVNLIVQQYALVKLEKNRTVEMFLSP